MLLLHLWSLSAEEQFFMIWPLALLFAYQSRLSFKLNVFVFVGLALFSFFGATVIASSGRVENQAFYLLPSRAGELLVGCILAFYEQNRGCTSKSASLGTLGLIRLLAATTAKPKLTQRADVNESNSKIGADSIPPTLPM
jgi:peptidoglycan/LPS O-acetylase OafA/YrhL